MSMLLAVFICCHTAAVAFIMHAALQMTVISVNKQSAIHQLVASLISGRDSWLYWGCEVFLASMHS